MSDGARLDTLRIELGLAIGEVAALTGKTERSVNRWVRGENPIPAWVFDEIAALRARMLRHVDFAVAAVTDAIGGGPLPLVRYRSRDIYLASGDKGEMPLGAHAMLVAWVARALEREGIAVDFFFADDLADA